jgi:hypothetical protein
MDQWQEASCEHMRDQLNIFVPPFCNATAFFRRLLCISKPGPSRLGFHSQWASSLFEFQAESVFSISSGAALE